MDQPSSNVVPNSSRSPFIRLPAQEIPRGYFINALEYSPIIYQRLPQGSLYSPQQLMGIYQFYRHLTPRQKQTDKFSGA